MRYSLLPVASGGACATGLPCRKRGRLRYYLRAMPRQFDAARLSKIASASVSMHTWMTVVLVVLALAVPLTALLLEHHGGLAVFFFVAFVPLGIGTARSAVSAAEYRWAKDMTGHIHSVLFDQGLLELAMLDSAAERLPSLIAGVRMFGLNWRGSPPRTFQARMERLALSYEECARDNGQKPLPNHVLRLQGILKAAEVITLAAFLVLLALVMMTNSAMVNVVRASTMCLWIALLNLQALLRNVGSRVAAQAIASALQDDE